MEVFDEAVPLETSAKRAIAPAESEADEFRTENICTPRAGGRKERAEVKVRFYTRQEIEPGQRIRISEAAQVEVQEIIESKRLEDGQYSVLAECLLVVNVEVAGKGRDS